MTAKQQPWIEAGYQVFAYEGPQGLKIEQLARKVGKSKSSFYHYFADLEVFTDQLLRVHLDRARIIAGKEAQAGNLDELIAVMVAHKQDLLFNRQLRVHRAHPAYEACFSTTNEMIAASLADIWVEILELRGHSYLARLVLKLSMENFYLQITEENLNHSWLTEYFRELRNTVRAFKAMAARESVDDSV
jgi:AcrR family transcriptional regulator